MSSDGQLYENIKKYLKEPDADFKDFLGRAIRIWEMKSRDSTFQFEDVIQIYLADKCRKSLGDENLLVRESVKKIVEGNKKYKGNDEYKNEKKLFKPSKGYIKPDMCLVSGKEGEMREIQEILEIKTTPNFDVSWMKDDISRLLKIKSAFQDIKCYELMVDYGKKLGNKDAIKTFLGKSKSKDKERFKTLLDRDLVVLKDDVISILSEEDIENILSDKDAHEIYDTPKERDRRGGIYGYIFSVEKKMMKEDG